MRISQNVAIVKSPLLWPFLIIAYCFVPMGKGICDWQQWYSIGSSGTGDPSTLHHEQTIFGEEIHTLITFRPLFVGFMFFIRKFPGWYAGGRVITITHYTHFKFLLSKFSQIMAKIIIMNVGIDKTFLKFKFSQEIINNGEKCG